MSLTELERLAFEMKYLVNNTSEPLEKYHRNPDHPITHLYNQNNHMIHQSHKYHFYYTEERRSAVVQVYKDYQLKNNTSLHHKMVYSYKQRWTHLLIYYHSHYRHKLF